jgi:hypothetical protein
VKAFQAPDALGLSQTPRIQQQEEQLQVRGKARCTGNAEA